MKYKINVCDSSSFNRTLTSIFFIVEYFNFKLTESKIKQTDHNALNIINKAIKELSEISKQNYKEKIALPLILDTCIKHNVKPVIDNLSIELVRRWLSDRDRERFVKDSLSNNAIKSSLDIEDAYKLRIKLTSFKCGLGPGWVSSQFKINKKNQVKIELPNLLLSFLNEPTDFIDVIQDILVKSNKMNDDPAMHYIQRWIRSVFKIDYNIDTKTAFSSIAKAFNRAFYSSGYVSRQKFKSTRSSIIEVRVLISSILDVLLKNKENRNINLNSIGIYLLLRLCKALRVRQVWADKEVAGSIARPIDKEKDAALTILFGGTQCLSALHPLEYNYFQACSFGSYSCIKGLNTLFRGGLLPYTNCGKASTIIGKPGAGKTTLALQRMVEIAFYGGLAVYFTFEEDSIIILDRLNSFRLVNFDHFNITSVKNGSYRSAMKAIKKKDPGKGLLLLYTVKNKITKRDIRKVIYDIATAADRYGWKYRALTIDSINSLDFKISGISRHISSKMFKRVCTRELIGSIKANNFSGLILSEKDDDDFLMLPYLSDVVIEIGCDEDLSGRWIEIHKARNQNFQTGKHPLRISDGKGIVIYPSINAVLSKLRHRISSTVSEERIIEFNKEMNNQLEFQGILEKSFTLIYGNAKSGKTSFVYDLICQKRNILPKNNNKINHKLIKEPETIMVVTFKTPEVRLQQTIRSYNYIEKKWQRIPNKIIRHFTPGPDITAEQLIDDIYQFMTTTKREGNPIERIVFDEVESASENLPLLNENGLLWPTILEMLSTEAITAFFVVESDDSQEATIKMLKNNMDYIFRINRTNGNNSKNEKFEITTDKWIDPINCKSHGPKKSIAYLEI